jgi:hypothetical protein
MKKHALFSLVLVFLSALATTTARAQNATPLKRRAGEVCAQFRQTPGDYDKMFAPGFLAQVPATQLTATGMRSVSAGTIRRRRCRTKKCLRSCHAFFS